VNWLIIAGTIAVFIWQTFSIQEREAQLPAMEKKYENVPVEDMAKELGVKDRHLKEIEKKAEEVQKKIDKLTESIDESIPSKIRRRTSGNNSKIGSSRTQYSRSFMCGGK